MQQLIQFKGKIDNGLIHVPEIYLKDIPAMVEITITPIQKSRPAYKARLKDKPASIDEFPMLLNTSVWKFNREEANERR